MDTDIIKQFRQELSDFELDRVSGGSEEWNASTHNSLDQFWIFCRDRIQDHLDPYYDGNYYRRLMQSLLGSRYSAGELTKEEYESCMKYGESYAQQLDAMREDYIK